MNELVVPTDEVTLFVADDSAYFSVEEDDASLPSDTDLVPVSIEDSVASLYADSILVIHVVPEPYEGEYMVTPKANEAVVLPTQHKTLTEDVTIQKVPYFETSNDHGTTVYIAEV